MAIDINYMGNFKDRDNRGGGGFRGGNSGGRPDFQKKSWGGDKGGSRDSVVMHKATCSECGNNCEVPFRPSGEKPVYCSNCFGSKREGGDRNSRKDFGGSRAPAPRQEFRPAPQNDDTKKQLAEISMKLDRLIGAIEKMNTQKVEKMAPEKPIVKKAVKAEKAPKKKVATAKKK